MTSRPQNHDPGYRDSNDCDTGYGFTVVVVGKLYVYIAYNSSYHQAIEVIPHIYNGSNITIIIAIMLAVGNKFANIQEAREAINRSILDDGESYKVYKSDSMRHILQCKEEACSFSIRAAFSKKVGVVITKISPHCCRPTVHYTNKQSSSLWFLKEHHRATVLENRNIIAT